MEDFVTYDLAVKLKEKGFNCNEPFAMYNELGVFHKLYSSADFTVSYDDSFRDYYDYDDFDEHDIVAPTISQVLKWLRDTKNIEVVASFSYGNKVWGYQVGDMTLLEDSILSYDYSFPTYEEAALAGVNYCLENLI